MFNILMEPQILSGEQNVMKMTRFKKLETYGEVEKKANEVVQLWNIRCELSIISTRQCDKVR